MNYIVRIKDKMTLIHQWENHNAVPKGEVIFIRRLYKTVSCLLQGPGRVRTSGETGGPVTRAVYHELGSDTPCPQLMTVVFLDLSWMPCFVSINVPSASVSLSQEYMLLAISGQRAG